MKKQGCFISLEGIDGSGKTTLAAGLKQYFSTTGHPITCLREPGGTTVSEAIRALLLNPDFSEMEPETEAFLYASARCQVRKQLIEPALKAGHIVLADRYTDSTLAYQGYGRGLSLPFLQELNQLCTGGLLPDLTLLLDISPEEAARRQTIRNAGKDRLEQEGLLFQQKICAGYQKLLAANPERIIRLDASLPPEELLQAAIQEIERRL